MDGVTFRERLRSAGVDDGDVVLPGEEPPLVRQGAMVVRVSEAGGGVDVLATDYGMEDLLARCSDLDEALAVVLERCSSPVPTPRTVEGALLDRAAVNMGRFVEQVRSTLAGSRAGSVRTELWDGAVVDRFGAWDGFLLWPQGVPLAHRSLPPQVLDPAMPELGLRILGVTGPLPVLAQIAQPWFGQPGGAVVLRIPQGLAVRDLVSRGALVPLRVEG